MKYGGGSMMVWSLSIFSTLSLKETTIVWFIKCTTAPLKCDLKWAVLRMVIQREDVNTEGVAHSDDWVFWPLNVEALAVQPRWWKVAWPEFSSAKPDRLSASNSYHCDCVTLFYCTDFFQCTKPHIDKKTDAKYFMRIKIFLIVPCVASCLDSGVARSFYSQHVWESVETSYLRPALLSGCLNENACTFAGLSVFLQNQWAFTSFQPGWQITESHWNPLHCN